MKDNRYMCNTKEWVWEGPLPREAEGNLCVINGQNAYLNSIAIVKGGSFPITVCDSGNSHRGRPTPLNETLLYPTPK